MLEIRLFGKPQVLFEGEDITPELGNKGCSLLCILFLHGGKYYAREKLSAYLWPDSSPSAAKYNLRYTLWKIKKSTNTGDDSVPLINLDRDYCCINRSYGYVCDLQTVDEIDLQTHSADELKSTYDALGGELLEGYYFNNCEELNELILSQRIYYENRKNQILMQAADIYEQNGMLKDAADIISKVLEYEPYNERLALRLMTLYERTNDVCSAILFYNEFRGRLASNLDISPGSAITQKYAELKAAPAASSCAAASDYAPTASATAAAAVYTPHTLTVETYCIEEIPCFWMADTVGKILPAVKQSTAQKWDRNVLRLLKTLQPSLGAYVEEDAANVSPAAVAQAFIHWLSAVAAAQPVTIHIANPKQMDGVSRGILSYIQHMPPKGLKIIFGKSP